MRAPEDLSDLPDASLRRAVWAAACAGDPGDVFDALLVAGLCPSLTPLFITAAAEYQRCSDLAKTLHALEEELALLDRKRQSHWARPVDLAVQDELNVQFGKVIQEKELARIAGVRACAVFQRFSVFISPELERTYPLNDQMPEPLRTEFRRLQISEETNSPWKHQSTYVAPVKPRRRLVAIGKE